MYPFRRRFQASSVLGLATEAEMTLLRSGSTITGDSRGRRIVHTGAHRAEAGAGQPDPWLARRGCLYPAFGVKLLLLTSRMVVLVVWALVVGLPLGVLMTPESSAAPSTCGEWNESLQVTGVPRLNGGRGGLEVAVSGSRQLLTAESLGLPTSVPNDRLGAAFSPLVLRDDQAEHADCLDLVVGAPGAGGRGELYVLRGTPSGFSYVYAVSLTRPGRGDQFGASVSAGAHGYVVAGAPGRDTGGVLDSGSVGWFVAGVNGPLSGQGAAQAGPVELSQSSPGVAGVVERFDRFGEVLTPAFDNRAGIRSGMDVFVGVPREDVGTMKDAGIVQRLHLTPFLDSVAVVDKTVYQQVAGGALGRAETGDRFGAALALGTVASLAVGVPGEDVGRIRDAGAVSFMVNRLFVDGEPGYLPFEEEGTATQNSRRVPGVSEKGDHFGAALSRWPGLLCPRGQEVASFAIGAPGEDLGDAADAGRVTIFEPHYAFRPALPVRDTCPVRRVSQTTLGTGKSERGDFFGAALSSTFGESPSRPELAVAVPGEDLGTSADAGRVVLIRSLPGAAGSRTALGGAKANLRYGTLWTQ